MTYQQILASLAKRYQLPPEEIEQEMQTAIAEAYRTSDSEIQQKQRQHIKPAGEIPTPQELIFQLAEALSLSPRELPCTVTGADA